MKKASYIAILYLMLGIFLSIGFFAKAQTLIISPSDISIAKNTSFSVNLDIDTPNPIYSVNFDLVYDPSLIDYVNFQEGTFLNNGCMTFALASERTPGRVVVSISRVNPCLGISGSGNVVKLNFQTLNFDSISSLDFENNSIGIINQGTISFIPGMWNNSKITIGAGDIIAPSITLIGQNPQTIEYGTPYTENGAAANDSTDGNLSSQISIINNIDESSLGSYQVSYNVSDSSGNSASAVRTVNIVDTTKPYFTNVGDLSISLIKGSAFTDPGVTAIDNYDGNITSNVASVSNVNTNAVGNYHITYNVSDSSGNGADELVRNVFVTAEPDTTPPVITVLGDNPATIGVGVAYNDSGATAIDNRDGDISTQISISDNIDNLKLGTYQITYTVSDSAGNSASELRTVHVIDAVPPTVSIFSPTNSASFNFENSNPNIIITASVEDNYDMYPLTSVTNNGLKDGVLYVDGTFSPRFRVTLSEGENIVVFKTIDSSGNWAEDTLTITYSIPANASPYITLIGQNPMEIMVGSTYREPGATAVDPEDGDISSQISVSSNVNIFVPGIYSAIYSVTDSSGNTVEKTRTVRVIDNTPPTIHLIGNNPFRIELNANFDDPGASASDDVDGDITSKIVKTGTVDTSTPGDYVLNYNVVDSSGNHAVEASRSVQVAGAQDTNPPARTNGLPTGNLPSNISQATLSLSTNEPATCKYSTNPSNSYLAMSKTFSTTGNTSHSTIVESLNSNTSYTYYVRCSDYLGNYNTNDYNISFNTKNSTQNNTGNTVLFFSGDYNPKKNDFSYFGTSWKSNNSNRSYSYERSVHTSSYLRPFSLKINAISGAPDEKWTANIQSNPVNLPFNVDKDSLYAATFFAKSSSNVEVGVLLEDSVDYNAITQANNVKIGSKKWRRYTVILDPYKSTNAVLTIQHGDMPENSSFYLDDLKFIKLGFKVKTKAIKGRIGQNKLIQISNSKLFQLDDLEIEVPYFENGAESKRRNKAFAKASGGFRIQMPENSFSGVASVIVKNKRIADINYIVTPHISGYLPKPIEAGGGLTIVGSGFNPANNLNNMYALVKVKNGKKVSSEFVKANYINDSLTEMQVDVPDLSVNGKLVLRSSFEGVGGNETISLSNAVSYKIKPTIFSYEWHVPGFEQVGDKILITGKGFNKGATVNFYNQDEEFIASKKAAIIDRGKIDSLIVRTPVKFSDLFFRVKSNGILSDVNNSQSYGAKPRLNKIASPYSRKYLANRSVVRAARVGDSITIFGRGFSQNDNIEIFFRNRKTTIKTSPAKIANNGSWIKTNVPDGALDGFVFFKVNGRDSNMVYLEIVPTITKITGPVKNNEYIITAKGVGDASSEAQVVFLSGKKKQTVTAYKIEYSGVSANVYAKAPENLPYNKSSIRLQYKNWTNRGREKITVNPVITKTYLDTDTNILYIRGYGFSKEMKKNAVTYRYADENRTIINPKKKNLGVFATQEGQEIRIKILDGYHYGWVSVNTGGVESNQSNFGPIIIKDVARRYQFVNHDGKMMGVLYISGNNFGQGGVKVGNTWARVDYRTDFFIIAVVDQNDLDKAPIIITKE